MWNLLRNADSLSGNLSKELPDHDKIREILDAYMEGPALLVIDGHSVPTQITNVVETDQGWTFTLEPVADEEGQK